MGVPVDNVPDVLLYFPVYGNIRKGQNEAIVTGRKLNEENARKNSC